MAGVVRWTFFDANTAQTVTYEVNPNEGGSPQKSKNVTSRPTTAPNGVVLMFEGTRNVDEFSWSGTLFTQMQYVMFQTWQQKRHQIKITDDLGRENWVYITDFDPQPVRSAVYPWKHTYTVKALALNWPS